MGSSSFLLEAFKDLVLNTTATLKSIKEIENTSHYPFLLQKHFTSPNYYECTFKGYENSPNSEYSRKIYSHLGYDTLIESKAIYNPRYFIKSDLTHILFMCTIGRTASGNEGFCHGGLTAILMDQLMGFVGAAQCQNRLATKNFDIEFFSPILCDENILVSAMLDSTIGNSLKMFSEIYNDSGELKVQSQGLFVQIINQWDSHDSLIKKNKSIF